MEYEELICDDGKSTARYELKLRGYCDNYLPELV